MLASADLNGDENDSFLDIDDFLLGIQQNSMPASANSNSGNMAEKVDNGTRGGSPVDSSCSTVGRSQDPIILSDDECVGAESETDYNDLDIDLIAKSGSNPSHGENRELADGDGFDTHQASKIQVNNDITQGSTGFVDLDVNMELEGNNEDDDDTGSTKGRELLAVSDKNLASDSNISKLRVGQPDYTQSSQLSSAAASIYQSDSKNDHLSKHRRRRSATRNNRRKRRRTTAPTGQASTASTGSTALKSSAKPQSQAQIAVLDQEMVNDGSTDDSDDGDYDDMSEAVGSKRRGRLPPQKRVRRTKDTEDNDVAALSTHSLDVSCQATSATSSSSMHESEEIPIHGYFTLKTIESKVVYCLTFSQELLPRHQHQGQRQYTTTDLEEPQLVASVADLNHQWGTCKIIGQKMVGCERQYQVEWKATWMPESELAQAMELVDAFMADKGSETGGRKRPLKRGRPIAAQPDARGEEELKKQRGRPRKQK